ncbi:MAG: replicative DNA helicase [Verrucomicrobiae bacterium]|nr:replicative DNA helicase [Verrucomicrobiae bacterium]
MEDPSIDRSAFNKKKPDGNRANGTWGKGKKDRSGPPLQKSGGRSGESSGDDSLRLLPNSVEAEKGVLSCMLQAPKAAIGETVERVTANHFHVPAHQVLYELIIEINESGKPVNPVSVQQTLMDREILDQVGGPAAVLDLFTFVPTAAHLSFYLDVLCEKYILRNIIESCTNCVTFAYGNQENVEMVLDEVERVVLGIRGEDKAKLKSMSDLVMEAIDEIEEMVANPGSLNGLPTGFSELDKMTNGLHGGEMFILAARPSMGKTSFVMNIVETLAVDNNIPCAVFSLEMSAKQLVQRLLCSRARINMLSLQSGMMRQSDIQNLTRAARELSAATIVIDDTPSISILELRHKTRRFRDQFGIKAIAIDYLQLMRSTSKRAQENRQQEIAEISSGIKGLAKELDIPALVLAQLNRNPEGREGGKPRLSDLRESGSIEQDADIVGLLVRSEYYAGDAEEKEEVAGEAELIIAKQRNGPTGEVSLSFLKQFMRFETRAWEEGEGGGN